ncbi:hypothetical protein HPP92_017880 [Vanilla planifolia]|uniref:Uncharacterized protein n=1 Tax=Vanilla planifolia TaxID=51239 RepID=A0A835UMT6_VANPL|nr:hypothetical protein HPP92_017880 [Vanilla planifolia]
MLPHPSIPTRTFNAFKASSCPAFMLCYLPYETTLSNLKAFSSLHLVCLMGSALFHMMHSTFFRIAPPSSRRQHNSANAAMGAGRGRAPGHLSDPNEGAGGKPGSRRAVHSGEA